MKTSGNTVLITGGATGIGFALTSSFINRGNKVIICGRRENKLREAREKLQEISIRKCDVSSQSDRQSLFEWATSEFPEMNILVNNAGIQRPTDLTKGTEDLLKNEDEIAINLKAQIYLAAHFIPFFAKKSEETAIINVSSALGLVPLERFPIYCATKAAIHSFTISLRHQLKATQVKIFEVLPPTVYDTELKGRPLPKSDWTVSSQEVADAVMKSLENDEKEISLGMGKSWLTGSKRDLDQAFNSINQ